MNTSKVAGSSYSLTEGAVRVTYLELLCAEFHVPYTICQWNLLQIRISSEATAAPNLLNNQASRIPRQDGRTARPTL